MLLLLGGIAIKHTTWLTTNELNEAAKTLKMIHNCLGQAEEDQYHWKWVLITLHNCLQGFMVCALRGKDGLNVLKDRVALQFREADQNNLPRPREELDTFLNLYKKIQSDKMLIYPHSKKFTAKGQHDRSVRKLNQLRNQFIHFKPKAWFFELNSLPKLAMDGKGIIDFLVFSSGNIQVKDDLRDVIRDDLSQIEETLNKLENYYCH